MAARCTSKQLAETIILWSLEVFGNPVLCYEREDANDLKPLDLLLSSLEAFRDAFDGKYDNAFEEHKQYFLFSKRHFIEYLKPRCLLLSKSTECFDFLLTCSFVSSAILRLSTCNGCFHFSRASCKLLTAIFEDKFSEIINTDSGWEQLISYCRKIHSVVFPSKENRPPESFLNKIRSEDSEVKELSERKLIQQELQSVNGEKNGECDEQIISNSVQKLNLTDFSRIVEDGFEKISKAEGEESVSTKELAEEKLLQQELQSINEEQNDKCSERIVHNIQNFNITDLLLVDDASNTKSMEEDITGQKSLDNDASNTKSTDEDVTGLESLDNNASNTKSIDEDVTGQESLVNDASNTKSIDEDVTGQESLEYEASNTKSIDEDVTGQESLDNDASNTKSIDEDVTGQESLEYEASNTKSIDEDVSDTESLDDDASYWDYFTMSNWSICKRILNDRNRLREVLDLLDDLKQNLDMEYLSPSKYSFPVSDDEDMEIMEKRATQESKGEFKIKLEDGVVDFLIKKICQEKNEKLGISSEKKVCPEDVTDEEIVQQFAKMFEPQENEPQCKLCNGKICVFLKKWNESYRNDYSNLELVSDFL